LFPGTFAGRVIAETPVTDHAFMLVGSWQCHSAEGTDSTWTVVKDGDASLTATNLMKSGGYQNIITDRGNPKVFSDRFIYDALHQEWRDRDVVSVTYNDVFEGTAQPWTGSRWQFAGRYTNGSGGAGIPEMKTYSIVGPDAVRIQIARGAYRSDSTCTRA
jgi:hypothetical protein